MAKVSRLSKFVKSEIIDSICSPSYKKRGELSENINKFIKEIHDESLPQDIQDIIKKYPEYTYTIYIRHHKTYHFSGYIKSFQKDQNKNRCSSDFMSEDEIKHLEGLIKYFEAYNKEIKEFVREIETILELPVKQIVETFPDIAHLIPDREGSTSINLPMVNVDSITSKLQNQPL